METGRLTSKWSLKTNSVPEPLLEKYTLNQLQIIHACFKVSLTGEALKTTERGLELQVPQFALFITSLWNRKSHTILFGGERVDTNSLGWWACASQEVCLNHRYTITGFLIRNFSYFPNPCPPHSQETTVTTWELLQPEFCIVRDQATCCSWKVICPS